MPRNQSNNILLIALILNHFQNLLVTRKNYFDTRSTKIHFHNNFFVILKIWKIKKIMFNTNADPTKIIIQLQIGLENLLLFKSIKCIGGKKNLALMIFSCTLIYIQLCVCVYIYIYIYITHTQIFS